MFVYRLIQGGDPVRVKLGSPNDYLNIKLIRDEALDVISMLRQGVNPNTERKQRTEAARLERELASVLALTVKTAFENYVREADIALNSSKQFL